MWKDILIILAFVLAVLSYFSLTPRRVSGFARTTKTAVAKRGLYQRMLLLTAVVASLYLIFYVVYRFGELSLLGILPITVILAVLWRLVLAAGWQAKGWQAIGRREKIALIAGISVSLSFYIAEIGLSDAPLWQKLVFPIGSFCLGVGCGVLTRYIDRKRESGRSEEDK